MGKTYAGLLFAALLFATCICLVTAQSGRAPREKTNNPGVTATDAKAPPDVTAVKDAGQPKIPLLVMLSRGRRLVMLPPTNEIQAERIARSLERDAHLSVRFDPRKIKLEDAQTMLRAEPRTYLLLLRFEEFDDRDNSNSCAPDSGRMVKSFKMDYTLLAPGGGRVVKPKSIQTFFSCDRNAKPLPGPFVKNCLNRSRDDLDDSAVQCMTGHVVANLYSIQ
jgi:hypothetical protein